MKKYTFYYLLLFCISGFALFSYYHTNLSSYGRIGKRNMNNAEKIKIGMSLNRVLEIMEPLSDSSPDYNIIERKQIHVLTYPSNNSDGLEIEIRFDTLSFVSKVIIPYNWGVSPSYK
jgi:hypothetical protein